MSSIKVGRAHWYGVFGLALCFLIYFTWAKDFGFIWNFGSSMEPTFVDNEFLVVQKRGGLGGKWVPSRFQIVLIRDEQDKDTLTKRVVGLEGDTIEIKEGFIYLNKKKLKDPFGHGRIFVQLVDENDKDLHYWGTNEKVIKYIDLGEITIPKGYVWVIGDNRGVSWFGVLPIKNIRSVAIF